MIEGPWYRERESLKLAKLFLGQIFETESLTMEQGWTSTWICFIRTHTKHIPSRARALFLLTPPHPPPPPPPPPPCTHTSPHTFCCFACCYCLPPFPLESWLGVQHQLTYLLPLQMATVQLSAAVVLIGACDCCQTLLTHFVDVCSSVNGRQLKWWSGATYIKSLVWSVVVQSTLRSFTDWWRLGRRGGGGGGLLQQNDRQEIFGAETVSWRQITIQYWYYVHNECWGQENLTSGNLCFSNIPGVWRYETRCRLYLACGHTKRCLYTWRVAIRNKMLVYTWRVAIRN